MKSWKKKLKLIKCLIAECLLQYKKQVEYSIYSIVSSVSILHWSKYCKCCVVSEINKKNTLIKIYTCKIIHKKKTSKDAWTREPGDRVFLETFFRKKQWSEKGLTDVTNQLMAENLEKNFSSISYKVSQPLFIVSDSPRAEVKFHWILVKHK